MGITGFAFTPTHPGDWAPEQLLLFNGIVQIKAAAVKGRVCGVQEILYNSGILRDPPFGRQNDNENWHCHTEQSEVSRLAEHYILAEILPPFGRQNDNKNWYCHTERSDCEAHPKG